MNVKFCNKCKVVCKKIASELRFAKLRKGECKNFANEQKLFGGNPKVLRANTKLFEQT